MADMTFTPAATFGTTRPKLYAKKVYEEAKAAMFFNRFSGLEGSGMPVIVKTELLVNQGQTITVNRLANLSAAGVSGETQLKGTEEDFTNTSIELTPTWHRHAVAASGLGMKQINFEFRNRAKSALSYWMAKKMDSSLWTAGLVTANCGFDASAISIVYGGNATSVDTLDSGDTLSAATIRKAAAVMAGNDIDKIRVPGMLAGDGYYLLFVHPHQAYSLKQDTEFIALHQNCSELGQTNPLFTGALGEIDGVIIHSTTQTPSADNAHATDVIKCAKGLMLGAESICRGLNKDITWTEAKDDYDFVSGIGVAAGWEDKVMNSKSIVQLSTACIAPA